ncbi:tetratricopeptide repeat protein [Tumebacillus permanentifrigoris]|uniref:Tetratricopeptide repeat protein n=1 Tax=Tumebacillus permanentifrigoris TaxID=378543 RepID=A0A316DTF7_9BACL|nr:tetratricopeptide repeat protein [Tumebacillus permanentifrigoris]PWK10289.1 tetratricopeptide repeat protein [Tumebacillus permanentifrigoris]
MRKRVLLVPWSLPQEGEPPMGAYARQIPRYLSLRLEALEAVEAVFAPFCLEGEDGPQLIVSGQTQTAEELCEIGAQYEADYVIGGHLVVMETDAEIGLQFVEVVSGQETARTIIGSLQHCRELFTQLLSNVLEEVLPTAQGVHLTCDDLSPRWEATAPFLAALDRQLAAEIGEAVTPEEVFEGFFAAIVRDPTWEEGAEQLIGTALDYGLQAPPVAAVGIHVLERLVQERPQMHKAWEALGYLYHADGRPADVIRVMEQAFTLAPQAFNSHHRLSAAYRQSQRFAEAEALLRVGLTLEADNIPLLNELGVVLGECERHEESAACFRRLVELSPISGAFHANLGITLQRVGRHGEAEEAFVNGMRALDPHWNVYVNYAELLEEQARYLEWVQVLFEGIRALDEQPEERIDLATRLVDGVHKWTGDDSPPPEVQAKGLSWLVGLLESLVEMLPEHQSSWVVLSELYRLDGRARQALECLLRVEASDPDNIWLKIHINSIKASLP